MKTVSVNIQSLCVPCFNRCRHCLLSWDGKVLGADFERSKTYAERFYAWIKANRPDLSFSFYFGYSMDHPNLGHALKMLSKLGSPAANFLQIDGLELKSQLELDAWLNDVKSNGVKLIDLTFYGTREYHDQFAGRAGDFDYLLNILRTANTIGLDAEASIALTSENVNQVDVLISELEKFKLVKLFYFVPHNEGRGKHLDSIRLSRPDLEQMSEKARVLFNHNKYKTEREWLSSLPPQAERRAVTISLTKDNIDDLEKASFEETIEAIEKLDDDFHSVVPSFAELAKMYGDKNGERFFSAYDLELYYQKKYIKDHSIEIYDIHDERQHFVRRF